MPKIPEIFESEYRFCLLLWELEPVNSTKLVEICKEKLGWSKATTYTVIRRLGERGILMNENAQVRSLVSKAQVQRQRMENLVEETFQGSLPAFIAAFSKSRKLSPEQSEQLQRLIDDFQEG